MSNLLKLFVILLSINFVHAQESDSITGSNILLPFKKNLQQALLRGLAEGPEQAINVCSLEAPDIAESMSVDGVRVGRTSERLRNPENVSPAWVSPILAAYHDKPTDLTPKTVRLDNDRTGYVEAITLQPVCLACHGENLSPAVSAQLDELYPSDRAFGYRDGELRGVFWVEYTNKGDDIDE